MTFAPSAKGKFEFSNARKKVCLLVFFVGLLEKEEQAPGWFVA